MLSRYVVIQAVSGGLELDALISSEETPTALAGVEADPAETDPMEFVVADLVWRCRWCDYQREARHPPQACPGCDGPNWFEGRSRVGWRRWLTAGSG
jgi:hypothetical protein